MSGEDVRDATVVRIRPVPEITIAGVGVSRGCAVVALSFGLLIAAGVAAILIPALHNGFGVALVLGAPFAVLLLLPLLPHPPPEVAFVPDMEAARTPGRVAGSLDIAGPPPGPLQATLECRSVREVIEDKIEIRVLWSQSQPMQPAGPHDPRPSVDFRVPLGLPDTGAFRGDNVEWWLTIQGLGNGGADARFALAVRRVAGPPGLPAAAAQALAGPTREPGLIVQAIVYVIAIVLVAPFVVLGVGLWLDTNQVVSFGFIIPASLAIIWLTYGLVRRIVAALSRDGNGRSRDR